MNSSFLIIFLTLCSRCSAQNTNDIGNRGIFSVPGISEILSNTIAQETGVVDLARTPDIFGTPSGFEEPSLGSVNGAVDIFGSTNPGRADAVNSVGVPDGFGTLGPDGFSASEPIPNVSVGSDPFLDGFSQTMGNTQGLDGTLPFGLGSDHHHHTNVGNNAVNTKGKVPPPVSDIHGNVPPHPTGTHVDMPLHHGNFRSFPVIHHGSEPIRPGPGLVDFNTGASPDNLDIMVNMPGENLAPVDIHFGNNEPTMSEVPSGANTAVLVAQSDQTLNHADNVFHANNVHRQSLNTGPVGNSIDLTAFNIGVGFESGVPGTHGADRNGHPVVHRDEPLHGQHGAPNDVPPGQLPGTPQVGFHIDMPGTNGVDKNGPPVVHRDGPQHVEHGSPNDVPPGQLPGTPQVGFHIDMPGTNGVDKNGPPVVHRDGPQHVEHGSPNDVPHGQLPGTPQVGFHIDMPGTNGADINGPPVVHRDGPTHVEHGSPNDVPHGQLPGTPQVGFHIDIPGTNGADINGPPVVHRDGPSHVEHGSPNDVPPWQLPGTPQVGFHIDMPGTNGADKNGPPVVHRDGTQHVEHGSPNDVPPWQLPGTPQVGFHIDMPGTNGADINGPPVVHRDGTQHVEHGSPNDVPPGQLPGTPQEGFHIDMPGTNGVDKNGPPVVHRDGPSHVEHGSPNDVPPGQLPGTPQVVFHKDMPGTHQADRNGPLGVHRDGPSFGRGPHGSPGPLPGIPRGPVDKDTSGVHDTKPNGGHGLPFGSPNVLHQSSVGWVPGKQSDHGVHIDAPQRPGYPFNEPVFHMPPGATLGATKDVRVIPNLPIRSIKPSGVLHGTMNVPVPGGIHGGLGLVDKPIQPVKHSNDLPLVHQEAGKTPHLPTVVPTGVLPGTPNVPVPRRPKSLGEMLGIHTADSPVHLDGKKHHEPSTPVPHRSVLVTNARGYTGGRRVDGSRRGVGRSLEMSRGGGHGMNRGRNRGRSRGRGRAYGHGRVRGGLYGMHARSNPFGNVGNVLQSSLTVGGPGGGGLLGSLVRTALGTIGHGGGVQRIGSTPARMLVIGRAQPSTYIGRG